jgi:hypothetical protein
MHTELSKKQIKFISNTIISFFWIIIQFVYFSKKEPWKTY